MKVNSIYLTLALIYIPAYSVSVDCPNLISFASGLGIQSRQPAIWTQIQDDCCIASGITCVNQRITHIIWNSKSLNGFINGAFLPATLTNLGLALNQLTGIVPVLLPSNLTYLYLSSNLLTGSIPANLPRKLQFLYVYNNQMSGSIPATLPTTLNTLTAEQNLFTGDLSTFPAALQNIYLGYAGRPGTHFTGTLRLTTPIEIFINDNWITDIIIQDTSQLTSNCDLSNNPLLGNLNIAVLTMCTKNALYSASQLPITITTTAKSTSSLQKTTSQGITLKSTQMTTTISKTTTIAKSVPTSTIISSQILETMSKSTSTRKNQIVLGRSSAFISTSTPSHNTSVSSRQFGFSILLSESFANVSTTAYTTTDNAKSTKINSLFAIGVQLETVIIISFGMVLRVFVSALIFGIVMFNAPFKRGLMKITNRIFKRKNVSAEDYHDYLKSGS